MRWTLWATLAGCAKGSGGPLKAPGGETGAEGDTIAMTLRETDDLCAYEDGEIVEVPPATVEEGYIADVFPELYQPCLDGLLFVGGRALDYSEGHYEEHLASATFFTISTPYYSWMEGSWLDELIGTDDCGLLTYLPSGLETNTDLTWLDPGEVNLLAPWGSTPLVRYSGGLTLNFDQTLSDIGLSPAWGEAYGLSVSGSTGSSGEDTDWGGFAAVELPEIITLPEALEVTAPTPLGPGVALARADTPLVWTGTSDGVLSVTLSASADRDVGPFYEIRCTLADDGAFTLPGDLLSALPAGSTGALTVKRRNDSWTGTTSGRSFHAVATAQYEAWDLTIP